MCSRIINLPGTEWDGKREEELTYNVWCFLSSYKYLSEDFIRKFQDKVDWNNVCKYQTLSESFIREFQNKVNWYFVSQDQILSESFIKDFKHKIDWSLISEYQTLSEDFIREFRNEVDWESISTQQTLSESFIEEFQNEVDWIWIPVYQILSASFIEKFRFRVMYEEDIVKYNILSKEFKTRMNFNHLPYPPNMDKTEENWKNEVISYNEFECYDDYFIAYKAVKKNRCSPVYNMKYEKDKTYTAKSDYDDDDDCSFGLNCGGKSILNRYNQCILIKVKIYYKDLTYIGMSRDSSIIIRTSKLTVLE